VSEDQAVTNPVTVEMPSRSQTGLR
jgi:hypothetical protein